MCVTLGLFTLSRNPRSASNIGVALGLSTLAIVGAGNALILLSGRGWDTTEAGIKVYTTGLALLPLSWTVFSRSFSPGEQKSPISRSLTVPAALGAAAVFFIYFALTSKGILIGPAPATASLFATDSRHLAIGPLGRVFYIYILLGLVYNLMHLEGTLRSSRGLTRWKIKYVIFGAGSILAFFIYLASQALLFSTISFETIPLTAAVVIIATAMMGIFIVRHRLLDVDIFVSRHVVYNSLSVLIVGTYLLAVGLISQGIKYFNVPFDYFFTTLFLFTAMLGLVVFMFTARLRRKVKLLINKHFYKHKYEFRDKWLETIEKISSKTAVDEVKDTLMEMTLESMGAKPSYLWLLDAKSKTYVIDSEDVPLEIRTVAEGHPFVTYLRENPAPGFLDNAAGTAMDAHSIEGGALWEGSGCALYSPLVAGHELTGFMLLGPDISGEPYREDDLEFIGALSSQAAVQIKNIRMAQELVLAREVEAFSKMSSFIMHDLKNLTNSLSLISQNARFNMDNPEFQKDAIKTIDGTVGRMKNVIEKLSMVPREVKLHKKKTDVQDIVQTVIRNAVTPRGKEIEVSFSPVQASPPTAEVDPDAIEMVVLNLVINAFEAIEKHGKVRAGISVDAKYVNIEIADNGEGMSDDFIRNSLFLPFRTTKKKGIGIGLYQCKSIVDAHGGLLDVVSAPRSGTVFTLRLPLCKPVRLEKAGP